MKLIFFLYIFFVCGVVLLNISEVVGFGHGFGDLYNLAWLIILTIIYSFVFGILNSRREYRTKAAVLIFPSVLLLTILVTLVYLTILRGPELPWDGRLFH